MTYFTSPGTREKSEPFISVVGEIAEFKWRHVVMHKTLRSLLCATVIGLGAVVASQAQAAVKVGVLTCNVSSGWGIVFGSSRDLRCNFQHADGHPEH